VRSPSGGYLAKCEWAVRGAATPIACCAAQFPYRVGPTSARKNQLPPRGGVRRVYMPPSGAFMLPGRRDVYVAGSQPPIVPLRKGDSWACGKRNGRERPAASKTMERALRQAKRWRAPCGKQHGGERPAASETVERALRRAKGWSALCGERNRGPRRADTASTPGATPSPLRTGTTGGRDPAANNGSAPAAGNLLWDASPRPNPQTDKSG
jgi:hypothetical protein